MAVAYFKSDGTAAGARWIQQINELLAGDTGVAMGICVGSRSGT